MLSPERCVTGNEGRGLDSNQGATFTRDASVLIHFLSYRIFADILFFNRYYNPEEDLTVLAAVLLIRIIKGLVLAAEIQNVGSKKGAKMSHLLTDVTCGSSLHPLRRTHWSVFRGRGCGACRKCNVLRWTLSQPPCSVGFAATSTSSSERLSRLHSSSWCTGISSASGLCHGSPTSLIKTDTQHNMKHVTMVWSCRGIFLRWPP